MIPVHFSGEFLCISIDCLQLIRISGESEIPALTSSRETAKAYCDNVLSQIEKGLAEQSPSATAKRVKAAAFALNGEIEVGDLVISSPYEDYACLFGQVIAIDKLGTPEHDTENETDDVHVNFAEADYSYDRTIEIGSTISALYGDDRDFEDIALDDVIMSPESLLRLPETERDELDNILESYESASKWFENAVSEHFVGVEEQLVERVQQNHADFLLSLESFGTVELIDMAHKIAAMSDACEYMTASRGYEHKELWFYMQLENPLEVVADAWLARNSDISDLSFTMDFVLEHSKTNLAKYPLITDESEAAVTAPAPATPAKNSLADQLREGKEKVEAYKAEQAAVPTAIRHNIKERI